MEVGMKAYSYLVVLFVLLGFFFFLGCSATYTTAPRVKPPNVMNFETLNRSQYEVLEQTSGSATTHSVGLWPLPIWWQWSDDGSFWLWGLEFYVTSKYIATTRAIEKVPGADEIIEPIRKDDVYIAVWYNRMTTTVKGKAISINSDKKCKEENGKCWDKDGKPLEVKVVK